MNSSVFLLFVSSLLTCILEICFTKLAIVLTFIFRLIRFRVLKFIFMHFILVVFQVLFIHTVQITKVTLKGDYILWIRISIICSYCFFNNSIRNGVIRLFFVSFFSQFNIIVHEFITSF